jgi:phage baseplate assembly protein V
MAHPILRWLEPLRSRVIGMVARAVVRSVNDARKLQEVELAVMGSERLAKAEHFQAYGLTSRAHAGAEAVVVFAQGNRDHPLVVAVDNRAHRPTGLAEGEVMVYAAGGQRVHLKADGSIKISSGPLVEIESTEVRIVCGGQSVVLDQDKVEVVGKALNFSADDSIDLAVGTSSVHMDPAGIVIAAPLIDLNQA